MKNSKTKSKQFRNQKEQIISENRHMRNISIILFSIISLSNLHAQTINKNILYLNAYHIEYNWARQTNYGVHNIFDTLPDINLYTEFLDSKRFFTEDYFNIYFQTLNKKYEETSFEIIMCSDNNALNFVLNRRLSPLFRAKPIVYCGITNTDCYENIDNIYGVKEIIDFNDIIEIINQTSPQANEVHILLNNTPTDNIYKNVLDSIQNKWINKLKFIYHIGSSIEDIHKDFSHLTNNCVIFYNTLTVDKYYKPVKGEFFLRELIKHSSVPIYGNPLALNGKGILGGQTNKAFKQGQECAKLALRLLRNEKIENKIIEPESEWGFDYNVIQKFNLDLSNFPENAIIYNLPEPVFQKYKKEIISAFAIIILLIMTVVLLSTLLIQRTKFQVQLLEEKNRAEESDRLKSNFLENISHEVRSPLNAIVGFSSILYEDKSINEKSKNALSHIIKGGNTLSKTIDNIIQFSLIKTKQVKLKLTRITLNDVIEIINYSIQEKGRLIYDKDFDYSYSFITDRNSYSQILIQIIDNALKFSDKSEVYISHKITDNYLKIAVSDSGIGILEKELNDVYKPFYKGLEEKGNFLPGAGLGLSIASALAKLINGEIKIRSNKPSGTTVLFSVSIE